MNPDTGSPDISYLLGAISGKIDLILTNQANDRALNAERFSKLEERMDQAEDDVAALKRDRAWVLGGAAAISTAAAALAGLLGFTK